MVGLRRRLRRIKLQHGGVTVQSRGIEMEDRRFEITRGGAPYLPILRVDDNFETDAVRLGASHRRIDEADRGDPDENLAKVDF
jgi:hypothetical protein